MAARSMEKRLCSTISRKKSWMDLPLPDQSGLHAHLRITEWLPVGTSVTHGDLFKSHRTTVPRILFGFQNIVPSTLGPSFWKKGMNTCQQAIRVHYCTLFLWCLLVSSLLWITLQPNLHTHAWFGSTLFFPPSFKGIRKFNIKMSLEIHLWQRQP